MNLQNILSEIEKTDPEVYDRLYWLWHTTLEREPLKNSFLKAAFIQHFFEVKSQGEKIPGIFFDVCNIAEPE